MISVPSGSAKASKPRALTCYICGRGYGTASLQIHLKQCEKLFLQQEQLKPKNERRKLPSRPAVFDAATDGGGGLASAEAMQAYNDEAFKNYNEQALIPCEYCGRTFLPDSLKHHRRACNADKPARPVGKPVRKGVKGPFKQEHMRPSTASALEQRRRSSAASLDPSSVHSAAQAPTSPNTEKPWQKKQNRKVYNNSLEAPVTVATKGAELHTSHVRDNLSEAQMIDRSVNSPGTAESEHSTANESIDRRRRSSSYDPLELLKGMCIDLLQRGYQPSQLSSSMKDAMEEYHASQSAA